MTDEKEFKRMFTSDQAKYLWLQAWFMPLDQFEDYLDWYYQEREWNEHAGAE